MLYLSHPRNDTCAGSRCQGVKTHRTNIRKTETKDRPPVRAEPSARTVTSGLGTQKRGLWPHVLKFIRGRFRSWKRQELPQETCETHRERRPERGRERPSPAERVAISPVKKKVATPLLPPAPAPPRRPETRSSPRLLTLVLLPASPELAPQKPLFCGGPGPHAARRASVT